MKEVTETDITTKGENMRSISNFTEMPLLCTVYKTLYTTHPFFRAPKPHNFYVSVIIRTSASTFKFF